MIIGLQMGSAVSGIPLSQFLVHSWHQDSTEMVDDEIAKLLVINNVLNDNFLSFAGYQSEDSLSGIIACNYAPSGNVVARGSINRKCNY